MRELKNKLTSGKNSNNIKSTKGKMFGYQVLGFGGGLTAGPVNVDFLVIAGGGGGGAGRGGGGGAGGYRTSFPGGTQVELDKGSYNITIGAGGAGAPNTKCFWNFRTKLWSELLFCWRRWWSWKL